MQNQFTPNNRLASIGTVGLLFMAGIAGMVFLLPVLPAHAATNVSLSAASGTVGSYVTVTGTGFKPATDVAMEFGTTIVNTFGPGSGYPTIATLLDTSGAALSSPTPLGITGCNTGTGIGSIAPCVETDANGYFSAIIGVPPAVNGLQTVTVSDGTNVGTTTFTVTASLLISKSLTSSSALTSGLPDETFSTNIIVVASGLAASDTVTFTGSVFGGPGGTQNPLAGGTSAAGTTPATPTPGAPVGVGASGVFYTSGPGIGTLTPGALTISDVLGGKQTITGTSSSGLVPTTTFTINPVIALYASQFAVQTVFSMNSASTSAIFVGGMGFQAGTIAANSITIAGTTLTHPQQTVTATGNFGMGQGGHLLLVSGSAGLPSGPASMVIVDGANTYTFNYASHNIVNGLAAVDSSGVSVPKVNAYPGFSSKSTAPVVSTTGPVPNGYGAPLIVSAAGSGTSVATATLDSSSYNPNNKAFVTVLGSGFAASAIGGATVATLTPPGGTSLTFGAITTDSNGAFWALGNGASAGISSSCTPNQVSGGSLYCLNEEPYPSQSPSPATGYQLTVTGTVVAAVQAPTLNILPYISPTSTTASFGSSWPTITFHGFTPNNTCTLASAGVALTFTTPCTIGTNGVASSETIGPLGGVGGNPAVGASPDLPGGLQTLTGSDGVTTGTGQAFVLPVMLTGGIAGNTLAPNGGPTGTTSIIRSAPAYGVHGLAASTAYTIVWDPQQATETSLGSFTSTSAGNVPPGGIQFAVPAGQSGLHMIGLKSGSTYINFNVVSTSTLSPPATETVGPNLCTTACSPDASNNVLGSLARGQFGDGIFALGASLTAVPTVANVGGSVGITGTGLPANTLLDLSIGAASAGSCTNVVGSSLSGTFTTTGTGSVPSGTSVAVSDTPTYIQAGVNSPEQGSLYCVAASTPTQFQTGTGAQTGEASFVLSANANLNMTTAPAGHNVVITAHGLIGGASPKAYNILFNPTTSSGGIISGTVVGALLANNLGAAAGTFTVPNVATGAYSIQLQQIGNNMNAALATPPTLTVGSVSTSCNTTGCMTANGSSVEIKLGPNNAVQTSFTNNSNAPVTGIVYAVVHNAAGQTVYYTTATITANAGASATAYDVLFGLPSGTYSVSVFVTSTSGIAISTSSTVTVTI